MFQVKTIMKRMLCGQQGAAWWLVLLAVALVLGSGGLGWWFISTERSFDPTQPPDSPDWELPVKIQGFVCPTSADGSGSSTTDFLIVNFKITDPMWITHVQIESYASTHQAPNDWWRARIQVTGPPLVVIQDSLPKNHMDSDWWGLWGFVTMEFDPPLYVDDSIAEYTLRVQRHSGSTGSLFRRGTTSKKCGEPAWWSTAGYQKFHVHGYSAPEIKVKTIGYQQPGDGSIVLEAWADIYGPSYLGFEMADSEALLLAGSGWDWFARTASTRDGARIYYTHRVGGTVEDQTYHFRAYMDFRETRYYGEVMTFNRATAGELPILTCAVVSNDLQGLEFGTTIAGINAPDEWTINVLSSTTRDGLDSAPTELLVVANATADGRWLSSGTGFEAGVRYYYRARANEVGSTVIYSDVNTFVLYDPSQPEWINTIGACGNLGFTWIWWIIALVGLIAVWFTAGASRWWWLGVAGTFAILGILVAFDLISPWITVLMAILAGWIIFKFVFKHSGSTGS